MLEVHEGCDKALMIRDFYTFKW